MTFSKIGSKHSGGTQFFVFLRFFRFCRLTWDFCALSKTGAKSRFPKSEYDFKTESATPKQGRAAKK